MGIGHTLVAQGLGKSFRLKDGTRVEALSGISLSVRPGELTALVGPDGSGKTTLLRILAGLLQAEQGEISFLDKPWAEALDGIHKEISYMPQKFGLYEDLTVQENLDLYADLRGLEPGEREGRYKTLLEMSAMGAFRGRLAGKLSGGMKQKLGLICTLLKAPKLLLLDEPTVGVDPLSRRELWQIVESLTRQSGMSVIVSTSYLDEADRCDGVVLLFKGKELAAGKPESVRALSEGMAYLARVEAGATPRSLQAALLGAPGIVDAVPQGGSVRFVHGKLDPSQEENLSKILKAAEIKPVESSLEDSFMLLLREQAGAGVDMEVQPEGFKVPETVAKGEPVIETRNVSRLFGDFVAVNNVSFSVYRGEVFGLLGPNGAGKTTTFRMLCGLLPASGGSLYVAGVDVRKAREEARRRIGYVAQKFSLYGPLSVRENLDFFAGAYGLRGSAKKSRIAQVAADFSLEGHLDAAAGNLPGGYRQRLAMAVGLLHQPAILFLDEPTSGADPLARRSFWKRISGLADRGVTVVVTTHFMEEAEYCDRLIIQDNGVMLALGTPAEIRVQAVGVENPGMEDAFIAIVSRARKLGKEAA